MASLRASVTANTGPGSSTPGTGGGNSGGAAVGGAAKQYGYLPSPVGSAVMSDQIHAKVLIFAVILELAGFVALRYYFRDVLGG
jgi:hypothetical protein